MCKFTGCYLVCMYCTCRIDVRISKLRCSRLLYGKEVTKVPENFGLADEQKYLQISGKNCTINFS